MSKTHYTREQIKILTQVKRIEQDLVERERLEKQRCQPQLGVNGYMSASDADLHLDNFHPYHVLEENLRGALTKAISLGLSEEPVVKELSSLAFSKHSLNK